MANYKVHRENVLTGGPWPIVATGAEADNEMVFLEFQAAKGAALEIIDNEIARLRKQRMAVRYMKVKDAKLEET